MTDQQEDARPSYVTDTHLEFLDVLRESGVTNMFGAAPFLQQEDATLNDKQARGVVGYWMKTYGDRHPKDDLSVYKELGIKHTEDDHDGCDGFGKDG